MEAKSSTTVSFMAIWVCPHFSEDENKEKQKKRKGQKRGEKTEEGSDRPGKGEEKNGREGSRKGRNRCVDFECGWGSRREQRCEVRLHSPRGERQMHGFGFIYSGVERIRPYVVDAVGKDGIKRQEN